MRRIPGETLITVPMSEMYCYSVENTLAQIRDQHAELGRFTVRFYSVAGRPVREESDRVEEYYYYPSGGTIRDRDLNILFYEPRLDRYPPSNRDASSPLQQ